MESREREGERSDRERNPNPWIMARRRSKVSNTSAVRTCFVNFLPLDIEQRDLAHIFAGYGEIASISIPSKFQQNREYRYAFIKFYAISSFERAVKGENDRRIGRFRIRVYPAKHDMNNQSPNPLRKISPTTQNQPSRKTTKKPIMNYERDKRSYKEACLNHPSHTSMNQQTQTNPSTHIEPDPPFPNPLPAKSNPTTHNTTPKNHKIPPLEPEPQPVCFKFEPTMVRKVSSRILGEDTEKIRDELYVCTMENEEFITLKGSKNSDMDELLNRSVIATAQSSLSSNCILDRILMEGVTCLSIKPLGGLLHLVTFETEEDKKAMVECEWLNKWFIDVRNVNSMSSAKWRETHLRIYGMPLHSWGYVNFYNVGCIFGRVTSVDYSSFEYGKVTVISDCLFSINCKMVIEVDDKMHNICVSEDLYFAKSSSQPAKPPPINLSPNENVDGACETPNLSPVKEKTPPIPHTPQEDSINNYLEQSFPNNIEIKSSPVAHVSTRNLNPPLPNIPATSEKTFHFLLTDLTSYLPTVEPLKIINPIY